MYTSVAYIWKDNSGSSKRSAWGELCSDNMIMMMYSHINLKGKCKFWEEEYMTCRTCNNHCPFMVQAICFTKVIFDIYSTSKSLTCYHKSWFMILHQNWRICCLRRVIKRFLFSVRLNLFPFYIFKCISVIQMYFTQIWV